MIAQVSTEQNAWKEKEGLSQYSYKTWLHRQIKKFTLVAKKWKVHLLVFPELSVPRSSISHLKTWAKKYDMAIIAGSYYKKGERGNLSHCPIIFKHDIYLGEKISPSYMEISPIMEQSSSHPTEGLTCGDKFFIFHNTSVGNIAVLICSDFLHPDLRWLITREDIDILCVPAFQRNSDVYHYLMECECSLSENGMYIIYANMMCGGKGDGRSAFFGVTDRRYLDALREKQKKKFNFELSTKCWELKDQNSYVILQIDVKRKRTSLPHSPGSVPNVRFRTENMISMGGELLANVFLKNKMTSKSYSKKVASINAQSIGEYIKSAPIISIIDRTVAEAINKPLIYDEKSEAIYVTRVEYLNIKSFTALDKALRRKRDMLVKFITAFYKTDVASSWISSYAGMGISFLAYDHMLHHKNKEYLLEFQNNPKNHRNTAATPKDVTEAIVEAYTNSH